MVIMSSVAKAELGALFIKAKQGMAIWATLAEMGHLQLSMPIQTDNSTTRASSQIQYYQNQQKQWTCIFIVCKREDNKNNFDICGNQAQQI